MLFIEAIESVKCLDEGVIETVADANIGSIMGIGFPGWTGGVLQYINGYDGGLAGFVARARELAAHYGDRFEPAGLAGRARRARRAVPRRREGRRHRLTHRRVVQLLGLRPSNCATRPAVVSGRARLAPRLRPAALPAALLAGGIALGGFPGFLAGFVAALLGIDRLLDRMHGFGGWGMDDAGRRFDRLARERRRHPSRCAYLPEDTGPGGDGEAARLGVDADRGRVDRRHGRPAQGGGLRRRVPPAAVRPRALEPDVPRRPGRRGAAADLRLPLRGPPLRPRRPPPRLGRPRARRDRHRRRRDRAANRRTRRSAGLRSAA